MFQFWDIIVTMAFLAVYFYLFRKHAYWTSRNVALVPPDFYFGNMKPVGRTEQVGKFFRRFYEELKGVNPVVGMYRFYKPIAVVLNLELVKRILKKDCGYFGGRGRYCNERDDPLTGCLYNLSGDRGTKMHQKIAQMFSSEAIGKVFPMVLDSGKQFKDLLVEKVRIDNDVEFKNLLTKNFSNILVKNAFGIDLKTEFKVEFDQGFVKRFLMRNTPRIAKFFKLRKYDSEVTEYFLKTVRETVDLRTKNNTRQTDLPDTLIHMRKSNNDAFNEIAAQVFGFYLGGSKTCSTLIMWTLYELANAQVMQGRTRQHVKSVLYKFNGEMSYEAISAMTYLDQIIKESLRKYPPVPVLIRETTKKYTVLNTDTILEVGTPVYLPVYAIHHDPELFKNPERFDPKRFSAKDPSAWIPFGDGPRCCLGMQFGLTQAKVVLACLLTSFRFSIGSKCPLPLEVDVKSASLIPKDLWLNVESI